MGHNWMMVGNSGVQKRRTGEGQRFDRIPRKDHRKDMKKEVRSRKIIIFFNSFVQHNTILPSDHHQQKQCPFISAAFARSVLFYADGHQGLNRDDTHCHDVAYRVVHLLVDDAQVRLGKQFKFNLSSN